MTTRALPGVLDRGRFPARRGDRPWSWMRYRWTITRQARNLSPAGPARSCSSNGRLSRRHRSILRHPGPLQMWPRMVTGESRSIIQPPTSAGNGSGRASRLATCARTRRGKAAPGSHPSTADGEQRPCWRAAQPIRNLQLQDRPAGDHAARQDAAALRRAGTRVRSTGIDRAPARRTWAGSRHRREGETGKHPGRPTDQVRPVKDL